MKYIKSYESFKHDKDESVNENIFGGLFNLVKGVFGRAKAAINKTKGGKEVQAIYDKYLKIINLQLANKAKINLNLKSADQTIKSEKEDKNESLLIKEADEAPVLDPKEEEDQDKNVKLDSATLKQKMSIITQIINLQKEAAKKEMQKVLKKYGGTEKSPDLAEIIDNKIREFDLALLNAEMDFLDKAGDKTALDKVTKNRDKVTKELDASYKKIGTAATSQIKVDDKTFNLGKKYRYKSEDGVKTIVIKGKSEEEGKIKAAYTYGDTKDKEQDFTVDNIDTVFKPEMEGEYGYYSENNDRIITVQVIGQPNDKGFVQVKTGKADFNVEVGALVDKPEEK
jgi:hypothetical protein